MPTRRYTAIDFAILAVVAVVVGIIFFFAEIPYELTKAAAGKLVARIAFYGLWFIGGPLAASLIRKPGAAFLGETLGALVEAILPTIYASSVIVYGVAQGIMSEIAYAITGYRKWGIGAGALAGALPALAVPFLDYLLWGATITDVMLWVYMVGAMISGAIYGTISAIIGNTLRR